jgi:hypothetical protein
MRVDMHSGVLVAQKVLKEFRKFAAEFVYRDGKPGGFWVEAYSNCREQGYCIRGVGFYASFAEYRNSDSIVVYVGERPDSGNLPTDKDYENKEFFGYNQHSKAAAYIIKELRKRKLIKPRKLK